MSENQLPKTVFFGRYPQTADEVEKPIEWLVLDVDGDNVLLVSRYALDMLPFNWKFEQNINWAFSTLRLWLNRDFLWSAFTEEEQGAILCKPVVTESNPRWNTYGGEPVSDNVFLLDINEAEKLFKNDEERCCIPTPFAKTRGCWVGEEATSCVWWLRSPGCYTYYAACVNNRGKTYDLGAFADVTGYGVRPAIWVSASSGLFKSAAPEDD